MWGKERYSCLIDRRGLIIACVLACNMCAHVHREIVRSIRDYSLSILRLSYVAKNIISRSGYSVISKISSDDYAKTYTRATGTRYSHTAALFVSSSYSAMFAR